MRPSLFPSGERGSRAAPSQATVADSGPRMRHLLVGFALCLCLVWLRVVWLECFQGAAFRTAAARPLEKKHPLPGTRGRILSRDGRVLACDQRVSSLAVHYRFLEDPPNARWLRSQARSRVARDAKSRAARLAAEEAWINEYRAGLLENLGQLCGRPVEELVNAAQDIQSRVEAISATVNRRRQQQTAAAADEKPQVTFAGWRELAAQAPAWLFPPDQKRAPAHLVVAEELDYHVLVADVPLEVVAEVEALPEKYPGLRIVEQLSRKYPAGSLAANLLGHLGMPEEPSPTTPGDHAAGGPRDRAVGRLGTERQYEEQLQGRDGLLVDLTDHGGHWKKSLRQREPVNGRDLVLTLDSRLQALAEERLDRALAQRASETGAPAQSGGAIVLLDVRSGAILAAATAPRFNPNLFASGDAEAIERVLGDPAHPLFDRVTKMALPPGSVFKTVTALALLDDPRFDPREAFDCQGFLAYPDRQRCQIFRRYGVGHGRVDLADALVQSCNVYFFHHAERLGAERLAKWGQRLGLGRPTEVDFPGEAAGFLPTPAAPGRPGGKWELADTQALAIGQSTLMATPLQVARLMAAIANGGVLVRPHIVASNSAEENATSTPAGAPVAGLTPEKLEIVRAALARVVADPEGTAFAALADSEVSVAGKTGTAEVGPRAADHAWFAGYAPAHAPQVALAIVLEHRGSAEQAAMLAKEMVQAMQALGVLVDLSTAEVANAEHE